MALPQPPFGSAIQGIVSGGATRVVAVWQNWLQLVQNYIFGLTNSGPTSARPTKDLWVGQPFFDTTINVPVYWNGSTWVTSSPSGTVTAVTGTSPIASSGGTTPDISISQANATTNGYLSSTDWNTFNSKQPAGTYVNSVGAVSPVVSTGGTAPVISMPAASSSVSGYLTSADWSSFDSARTFINVTAYGVVIGDSSAAAANTSALQSIINANPYATLYFPAGITYVTSGLTCSTGISFFGNAQTSSAITSTSSTGDVLTITSTVACVFQNITFNTSTTRTSGKYIVITAPSGQENSDSVFINCGFVAGYTGIHFIKAAHWRIIDGQFQQQTGNGIIVENTTNIDSGDSTIIGCLFSMASGATGISQYSSGGLKILGSKFLGGAYHYLGQYQTGAGNPSTSILVISGNSMESATSALIAMNTNSNSFGQVNISGNQFSAHGTFGVQVVGTQLTNTYIGNNQISLVSGSTGIALSGGNGITIGTNNINGNGSGTGISIYGSTQCFVWPQSMTSVSSRYGSYTANTVFGASQMQTGSFPAVTTNLLYSAASNLYYRETSQTFSLAFPATPALTAYIYDPSGISGAVGVQVMSVSNTGATVRVIGANPAGVATIYYTATLSG